jgi:hypothetical protein
MRLIFSPQRRDDALALSRSGDVLTLNGVSFDLSGVPEGATLPAEAVPSEFVVGEISRTAGELSVTIIRPYGAASTEADLFPEPLPNAPNGDIIGHWSGSVTAGEVDLGQLVTAEDKAAALVPSSISPLQARRALRQAGLKAAVDAYVATLDEEEQEAWEYATEVRRENAIIAAGATALGLTDAQLDGLFVLGASLVDA